MIKYLIVDDEPIAHDIIKGYCDMLPNLVLQKNCYDAIEALEYLNERAVDLIFLDLKMPKLKGFEFLKTLPSPPSVIVTTAYQEFALEGYELNVVDYLLKPFSFERFVKAVNKAMGASAPSTALKNVQASNPSAAIFLRSENKYIQVNIADILILEAAGNFVKVVTRKDSIVVRDTFSVLLNSLPPDDFLQVHRSFAIAPKHIKSIEGNRISIGDHSVSANCIRRI
ncbi:MAG TPA: response regulator transcription factor [Chryseolinea sp.]